jgi:hypothetical protein
MYYVKTYLVYIVAGRSTCMLVHPPHEFEMKRPHLTHQNLNMVVDPLEHLNGSCWTGMLTSSQTVPVLVEEVMPA